MPDVEINRRIKFRIGKFINHIRANDANLRRAVGHEGRHIERADADDFDASMIGRKFKGAAILIRKRGFRRNPDACQQRNRLFKDAALWQGNDNRAWHDRAGFTCAVQ